MKILVFLQNMWVKNPDRVKKILDKNPELWNSLCKDFLFMGCITGKRIQNAFGELIEFMIFDETTKEIADSPKTIYKPDYMHIMNSVKLNKPNIILTFGNIAFDAVKTSYKMSPGNFATETIIKCIHPAARQPQTIYELNYIADSIRDLIKSDSKIVLNKIASINK